MDRRRALTGMGALTAWIALCGQAVHRQWKRSSAGDLLLYVNAQDPGSDEIGGLLAKQLGYLLPASGARVVRETTAARVAGVMATQRGNLAVIAYDIALEIYRGNPPFKADNPIELRVLVENYKYQVLCRADFERDRAYLVTAALMKDAELLKLAVPDRPRGRTATASQHIPARWHFSRVSRSTSKNRPCTADGQRPPSAATAQTVFHASNPRDAKRSPSSGIACRWRRSG